MTQPDALPEAFAALERLRFPDLALSAYLPADPGAGHHYYRALMEDLVRSSRFELDEPQWAALGREEPAVLGVLEKHRFDSPAVAVFSCQAAGLTRIWRLSDAVAGRITLAESLDLAPIRQQLSIRPPVLAALVDKHEARLFGLVLDELTELRRLAGVPIKHHRQGGWSATALQRREDEHTRENLGQVAGMVARLLQGHGYRRLILAGPQEARAELKSLLPPWALRLLSAEGAIPMRSAGNDLAQRLRSLEHAVQTA